MSAGGPDAPRAAVPRTTGAVERDGESVYYEVIGAPDGEWLILGHGAGGNHAVWHAQVAAFARTHRVLVWDQRGFGRSTNRTGMASPAVAATDLAALVDHLGVDRAHVVGQSMGGWAAMGFCLARPEVPLSLTLSDTLAGTRVPDWVEGRVRPRTPRPELGDHPALGPKFRESEPERALLYQQLGGWGVPDDQRVGALLGLLTTTFPPEELARFTERARLRAPVLFVVGVDDEIFPPSLVRQAATFVPGAEVVVIEGAGHSPYYETPDRFNAVLHRQVSLSP